MEHRSYFYVVVIYSDNTKFGFDVILQGESHEILVDINMITRGILMASSAKYAYAYKDDGTQACAFRR